jgi:diamine N-acetyltransferase
MKMLEIHEIVTQTQLERTTTVVREAFAEVAKEMGLTALSAPTHPPFTTAEKMAAMREKMLFFGLYLDDVLVGCVAVEKAGEEVYYLERLAVLPAFRHIGYGMKLVEFVLDYVKGQGGKRVSLGMINSLTALKGWYRSLGFIERGTKQFETLPFTVCFMDRDISA